MSSTRLVLVVIWVFIAGYLFWYPPAQESSRWWAGPLALAFAIYNAMRWWLARPRGLPLPSPQLRRRAHDAPPELNEYNEAFDFESKELKD